MTALAHRRAWTILARNQFLGFLREPTAALFNLAVPLFIIAVQAIAYGDDLVGADLPGYRVADVLPIGATVMYVMIIGVFGMSVGLASMVESRTLATYRFRPGGIASLVTAYGSVLLALTLGGLVIALGVLVAGWTIKPPERPWLLLPVAFGSSVLPLALGALIAARTSSPRAAQAIASAIFFPLLFLSGAMFPTDTFPAALRTASEILPGHHLHDLVSYCWIASDPMPWASLVYVTVASAVVAGLALRAFNRREDL